MPASSPSQPVYSHSPKPVNGYTTNLDTHIEYMTAHSAIADQANRQSAQYGTRPPQQHARTVQTRRSYREAVESDNDEVPEDLLISHHAEHPTTDQAAGRSRPIVVRGFQIPAPEHYTEVQAEEWYEQQRQRTQNAANVLHPNLERARPPLARPASIRLEESSQIGRVQPEARRFYPNARPLSRNGVK